MADTISLDAGNEQQVESANTIEADLSGAPGRKMLIFSGIARPEWEITDDDNLYTMNCVINLRQTVAQVEQSSVAVGLASFGNKNTTFQFAVNSAFLSADDNGALSLNVSMALRGDWSILNRFSYQVVATVITQLTGISGTLRWSKDVYDPSSMTPGQIASLFQPSANQITVEGGGPFGGQTVYTPIAWGVTGALSSDASDFILPYSIPGAPYNQQLAVLIKCSPQVVTTPNNFGFQQSAGPNPVNLTIAQPSVAGVDFRGDVLNVR